MKIKSILGDVLEVNVGEIYIKPFYEGKTIESYALCANKYNTEVVIASYKDEIIAKHMKHLLIRCDKIQGITHSCMSEVDLAEDLFLTASCRLRKAKEKYKEEVAK